MPSGDIVTTRPGHPENTAPDEHDHIRWFSADAHCAVNLSDPAGLPELVKAMAAAHCEI